MLVILGAAVVVISVAGGYLFAGGNLHVLFQPAELVIIGGAAVGSFLIASPKALVFEAMRSSLAVIKPGKISRDNCLDLLKLLFELLNVARREGIVALEPHINAPEKSAIFARHPSASDHELRDFICDNFKLFLTGNLEPHQVEALLDMDMETQHAHEMLPSQAVAKVADALPGLGIVAAVLGVVLTMAQINEPPEVLGHSIGAALVGTFLGVLACYGFVGPLATRLEHRVREQGVMLAMVKAASVAFSNGWPPILAVESARRAVPPDLRPSFNDLEKALRNVKG